MALEWAALERGDATAAAQFCSELSSKGYAILRLPDVAEPELAALHAAASAFFARPAGGKSAAGREEAKTYVGYRDSPNQGAEFLETYLTPEGGCYPCVEPSELAAATSALHIRLSRVGRTLLTLLATHLGAAPSDLLAPLETQTAAGLPTSGPSSRLAVAQVLRGLMLGPLDGAHARCSLPLPPRSHAHT